MRAFIRYEDIVLLEYGFHHKPETVVDNDDVYG